MHADDRFDLIIRDAVEKEFPELLADLHNVAHLRIKAQIWQESRFKVQAKSSAGAMGLMQIMPATAKELGLDDPLDPVQNIFGGVRYLAQQYRKLAEIPIDEQRWRFALASYNGGRGYVNLALVMAREAEGLPGSWKGWNAAGRPPGYWQQWDVAKRYLSDPRNVIAGRNPDEDQMIDYVERIEGRYNFYLQGMLDRGRV